MNIDLPELYKIKNSHRLLLSEYIHALSASSRLSCLVGQHEVGVPKKKALKIVSYVFHKFSPLRVFALSPFVDILIQSHIHKKLVELEKIYVQTRIIANNYLNTRELAEWLNLAIGEIGELRKTIRSGKFLLDFLKYFSVTIVALFLAATASTNIAGLIVKIFNGTVDTHSLYILMGYLVVLFVATYPIVYVFTMVSYSTKRKIFLNIQNNGNNIYQLENELFDLLKRGKPKEWPLDFLFELVFFALYIYFFSWLANLISVAMRQSSTYFLNCFWCFPAFFVYLFVIQDVIPWFRRVKKREM